MLISDVPTPETLKKASFKELKELIAKQGKPLPQNCTKENLIKTILESKLDTKVKIETLIEHQLIILNFRNMFQRGKKLVTKQPIHD